MGFKMELQFHRLGFLVRKGYLLVDWSCCFFFSTCVELCHVVNMFWNIKPWEVADLPHHTLSRLGCWFGWFVVFLFGHYWIPVWTDRLYDSMILSQPTWRRVVAFLSWIWLSHLHRYLSLINCSRLPTKPEVVDATVERCNNPFCNSHDIARALITCDLSPRILTKVLDCCWRC